MKRNFSSGFGFLHNHRIMLSDRKRTLAYKAAIEAAVKKGCVCLDLGSGTGILSFFAAKKKCRRVYAVERVSNLVSCARKAALANGLSGKITFVQSDIYRFRPKEHIDLLIQEQIGCFIWDEEMIAKVAYVRDRFLAPGARMIPEKMTVYFVPVGYVSEYEKNISFWRKKKYGLDLGSFEREAMVQSIEKMNQPMLVSFADRKSFLCAPQAGYTIDFRQEKSIPGSIRLSFDFRRPVIATGICLFFVIHLDKKRFISTAPAKELSSWRQIFLHSLCPLRIPPGSSLDFELLPKKMPAAWRWQFKIRRKG